MEESVNKLERRATKKTVWIPLRDAARVAGVSERTVRRWIADGLVESRLHRGRVQVDHASLTAGVFRNDWRAQARACLSRDIEAFAVSQWTRMMERALVAREGGPLPVDAVGLLNRMDERHARVRVGDLRCGQLAEIMREVRSDYFGSITTAFAGASADLRVIDLLRELAAFFGCTGLDEREP